MVLSQLYYNGGDEGSWTPVQIRLKNDRYSLGHHNTLEFVMLGFTSNGGRSFLSSAYRLPYMQTILSRLASKLPKELVQDYGDTLEVLTSLTLG